MNLDNIDVFNNNELLVLLNDIKNNLAWKETICSKSYLHVNNFYKINIGTDSNNVVIRLHYWRKIDEQVQNPHCHGWDFKSKIVRGGLHDTHYLPKPDKDGSHVVYYQNLSKHASATLIEDVGETFNMEIKHDICYKTNDEYQISTDVIHTAYPLMDKTVTILKQEQLKLDSCSIYSKEQLASVDVRKNISVDVLDTILADVISFLNKDVILNHKH